MNAPVLIHDPTELEYALAAIDATRISGIDVDIIRRIHSIDETPERFLPALAWEYSVDEWDPDWPIEVKRNVIKASYEVHRYKGTAYAVEIAIKALGLGARIEEWFEYGGGPYRFRATVDLAADQPWPAASTDLVVRTALQTKNVRSRLEVMHLRRSTPGALFIGGFHRSNQTIRITPILPTAIGVRPYLFVGGALRIRQSTRIAPET